MKAIAIIPARYSSTRFPVKVLADLKDKPLIQHTWINALNAKLVEQVIIATDHKEIYRKAKNFGAEVELTSVRHQSGTDRIAEVVLKKRYSLVVNLQADEPFIKSETIDQAINVLNQAKNIKIATLCTKVNKQEALHNPHNVKVVRDKNNFALYFSRSIIPYQRDSLKKFKPDFYLKHIGLYVYRKNFLIKFSQMPPSPLETSEKLEQLRILENGFKIKLIEIDYDPLGIDTPEDLIRARKEFRNYHS